MSYLFTDPDFSISQRLPGQNAVAAPLLQKSYYVNDPAVFYGDIIGTLQFYQPQVLACMPSWFVEDIFGNKNTLHHMKGMAGCSFNLSKSGVMQGLDFEQQQQFVTALSAEFFDLTGGLCGIWQHRRAPAPAAEEPELLLVCNTADHTDQMLNPRSGDRKGKAAFFAFLAEKCLLTDAQLENSELTLGLFRDELHQARQSISQTMMRRLNNPSSKLNLGRAA